MLRTQKQTALAFLFQGIFYFIGYSFVDTNTVLPLFIEQATGQLGLAGAASTIRQFATFLFQVLLGTYVVCVANVPRFISRVMAVGFSTPLLVVLGMGLGVAGLPLALLCLAMVAVMWSCDGLIYIGYFDLMGRAIPGPVRSRVLGMQQVLGSIGGLGSAFVIKLLLDNPNITHNTRYMLLFSLGGVLLLCAAASMRFAKDVPHRKQEASFNLKEQFSRLGPRWRANGHFRLLMLVKILFTVSVSSAPYLLLFSRDSLFLATGQVSTLLNIQVLGALLGGVVCMWFAPRQGNMFTVLAFCIFGLGSALFALLALWGAGPPFVMALLAVLAGGLASASWAGFANALLDVSETSNVPSYMLLNSLLSLPLALTTIGAGFVAQVLGYGVMLACCLAFSLSATVLALLLMARVRKQTNR